MKPFCPSNSDDLMGLVENHCMKCCHEEYSRDPEADGERCPILTDIILGHERVEVIQREDGSVGCKHWKQWEGSFIQRKPHVWITDWIKAAQKFAMTKHGITL